MLKANYSVESISSCAVDIIVRKDVEKYISAGLASGQELRRWKPAQVSTTGIGAVPRGFLKWFPPASHPITSRAGRLPVQQEGRNLDLARGDRLPATRPGSAPDPPLKAPEMDTVRALMVAITLAPTG